MLQIIQVDKSFEAGHPVLSDISLTVEQGEIICLLGPSGCGKTTLLRIVAGLEQANSGSILYQGTDLAEMPVHKRNFGMMFQDFALFPHRTVGENIAFGLRMAKWPVARIQARVAEMLSLIELPARYADRTIFELSGGERQRVALARSLAPGPKLLMLDEPLGNLDRALRESLMTELRVILKRLDITAIYVTHDQTEAYAVADRIVLLQDGQIEQVGEPEAVYMRPATPFAARFLGFDNLFPARVIDVKRRLVVTSVGRFELPRLPQDVNTEREYLLLIHPQAASIADPDDSKCEIISAATHHVSFRGDHYEVTFGVAGEGGEYQLHCELSTSTMQHLYDRAATKLIEAEGVYLKLDTLLMSLLEERK